MKPRYTPTAEASQADRVLKYLDSALRPLLQGTDAQLYQHLRHQRVAPGRVSVRMFPGGPTVRVPASSVHLDDSAYAPGQVSQIVTQVIVPMIERGDCPDRIVCWLADNTRGALSRTHTLINNALMKRRIHRAGDQA